MTAQITETGTVPCIVCGEPVPSSWPVHACGYAPLPEDLQISGPMWLYENGIRWEAWAAEHPWQEDAAFIAGLEPLPLPLPNAGELRDCADRAYAAHKGITVAELRGLPRDPDADPEPVPQPEPVPDDDASEPVPAAGTDDAPEAEPEQDAPAETVIIDAVTETDEAA